jgi:hypothetical protein
MYVQPRTPLDEDIHLLLPSFCPHFDAAGAFIQARNFLIRDDGARRLNTMGYP